MRKTLLLVLAIVIGASLSSCGWLTETDRAQRDRLFSDNPATLVCYDFGVKIYEGRSKGKPQRDDTGDGWWSFVEAGTNQYTTVEGNCIVQYTN